MSDDMHGMMMRMAGMQSERQKEEPPPLPMREAQADFLDAVFAHAAKQLRFSTGDVVHYPPGHGPMNNRARVGLEHRFLRYLNFDRDEDARRLASAEDVEILTLPTIDCLIVSFDGKRMAVYLASSMLLHCGPPPEPIDD